MSSTALSSEDRWQGPFGEAVPEQEVRQSLLETLRGSTITLPDLQEMLAHWPAAVHPEVKKLDEEIQPILESILSRDGNPCRLRKMKSSAVATFGASWWPYASFDALRTCTLLSVWLFIWDDETDSFEYSAMCKEFGKSCEFRRETIRYIEGCLQPDSQVKELGTISTNPIITNFQPVGQTLTSACNQRQLKTFLKEMVFFIDMTEEEHIFQQRQILPTIQEYMRRRMGSSAVRVCLALSEFALGIDLPEWVMEDECMKTLWHETNSIISIINDCLSIRKELAQTQLDSLIPILTSHLTSPQAAVDHAVRLVHRSINNFEAAEADLLSRCSHLEDVRGNVKRFADSCKISCTANLNWSLVSGRYFSCEQSMKGGLQIAL